MAANIQTLHDQDGNDILPRTRSEAVTMEDGTTTLEDKLDTFISTPDSCIATGQDAVALGHNTQALSDYSIAFGEGTIATAGIEIPIANYNYDDGTITLNGGIINSLEVGEEIFVLGKEDISIEGEDELLSNIAEKFPMSYKNAEYGFIVLAFSSRKITEITGLYKIDSNHTSADDKDYFYSSYAQGTNTIALGGSSHVEGFYSKASGKNSHAQNNNTIASGENQTALGRWNVEDTSSVVIVGNGNDTTRSNALTVDWDGNVNIAEGAEFRINGDPLKSVDAYTKDETLTDVIRTKYDKAAGTLPNDIFDKLSAAALRKQLGNDPIRTVVKARDIPDGTKIYDGNTIYVKIATDHFGSAQTLINIYASSGGAFDDNSSTYENSNLDLYLNTTLYNNLPNKIKDFVTVTDIESNGGILSRKVFALSAKEWGYTTGEGTTISYYSDITNRITTQGNAWTRTIASGSTLYYLNRQASGLFSSTVYDTNLDRVGYFNVNDDFYVYLDTDGKYYTEQIYTPAINSLIDMLGNEFVLPYAQIETGSYTGMGTYGSSNSNSLTFSFIPKILIIRKSRDNNHNFGTFTAIKDCEYVRTDFGTGAGCTYCVIANWDTTIEWYAMKADYAISGEEGQMNTSNQVYYYFAIG